MTENAPDPLLASWQELRAHLSDDDGAALELLGGLAGTMAISTVLTRMTDGEVEPWEAPLADAAGAFYRRVRAVARAWRTGDRNLPALQASARKAEDAVDAIMAPRRAAMHRDPESLEAAALNRIGPHSEAAARTPVPDSVVMEASLEFGEIVGSAGGKWLNRHETLLTAFADADALLRADEACELSVLASEFIDGHVDRYLVRSSPWARRRCTRRVNAALDALRAFAERNPSMVG